MTRTPRSVLLLLLLLALPSCFAMIGNSGTFYSLPDTASPLLREKVVAAERILQLRQQKLDELRAQFQAGRMDEQSLTDAEIAVEEARIQLLQFRAELQALESRDRDEDD